MNKRCNLVYGVVIVVLVIVIIVYLTLRSSIRGPTLSNVSSARDQKYAFEIQTVKTISYAHGGNIKNKNIEEHPFYELDHNEQLKLCFEALEHLALKNVDIEVKVYKFAIFHFNKTQGEDQVGMRCSTIPFVLLCSPGNSNDRIRIILEENQFLNERYELNVETIKSAEYQHAADANSVTERDNRIFNNRQRWEMCVAAKSRTAGVKFLSSYDWSDTVGMYKIIYPDGKRVEQVVAFPCNTSPKIYLCNTPKDSNNKLKILMEKI